MWVSRGDELAVGAKRLRGGEERTDRWTAYGRLAESASGGSGGAPVWRPHPQWNALSWCRHGEWPLPDARRTQLRPLLLGLMLIVAHKPPDTGAAQRTWHIRRGRHLGPGRRHDRGRRVAGLPEWLGRPRGRGAGREINPPKRCGRWRSARSYGASSTASAHTIAVPGSVTWTARTSARSWSIVAWPGTVPGSASGRYIPG